MTTRSTGRSYVLLVSHLLPVSGMTLSRHSLRPGSNPGGRAAFISPKRLAAFLFVRFALGFFFGVPLLHHFLFRGELSPELFRGS